MRGNGTQVIRLRAEFDLAHITTGDYCASTAREARICVETLPRTWLRGSSCETRSSSRWCGNDPAGPRFLIDGLPRTAEQARALTDLVKAEAAA